MEFLKLKTLLTASIMVLGVGNLGVINTEASSTNSNSVIQEIKAASETESKLKIHHNYVTKQNDRTGNKTSLQISFIDDPASNKKIAVISTEGSIIDSGYKLTEKRILGEAPGYFRASLDWASGYTVGMKLEGGEAKFHKMAPINSIDTKTISSTIGYNIGGSLSVGSEVNGSFNWSMTASYDQEDYKTVLKSVTDKDLQWEVGFVSAMNQGWGPYNRDSTGFWGNELFMKTRNQHWAINNFLSPTQMPSLSARNFSPAMVATVIADKNEKLTKLKVYTGRWNDQYDLNWISSRWVGTNTKNISYESSVVEYTLDWKNMKVIE